MTVTATETDTLPELTRGDVITDGKSSFSIVRREKSTGEFDEPVYVLRSLRSGVKLRERYPIEQLAGERFRLVVGS